MHFVFLNQYYPPNVAPTGVMLEAVVRQLVRDGHSVTVLCASGGYGESAPATLGREQRESLDGEKGDVSSGQPVIVRIGATQFGRGTMVGKLLDYASYYGGAVWKLGVMSQRPDRIVALTTPPYLSVVARAVSWFRRADHAHWVMDLYPDVMVAHGMLREGGMLQRVLGGLARWGFGGKRCAAVLTLGPDMAERVGHYVPASSKQVEWVPLWGGAVSSVRDSEEDATGGTPVGHDRREAYPPLDSARKLRQARGWRDEETVVMYSGNMGLGHRFGDILEVALALKDEPIRFAFYGSGKRRGEIEAFLRNHPECKVELHGYAPAEELGAHLRSADVHLASLDAAWTGTMVPSKLQGIFAAGRPVIFVGSGRSSIGQWISASGAGWVVEPSDCAGLRTALAEAGSPDVRERCGRAAAVFAAEHFDEQTNVAAVAAIFGRARDC